MPWWTDFMVLTLFHISPYGVKLDIRVPLHTRLHTFNSYTYIYHLWSHVLTLVCVHQKSLHVFPWVAFYFSILIPMFIFVFCHTHKDMGVLGYPNQYYQCDIPLSTISNNIPSIEFLIIFSWYLFILSILISIFKNRYFTQIYFRAISSSRFDI